MKISLGKFESALDYRIISRGDNYFRNGAVRNLKKIKDNEWIASVEGTEVYKVCVCLSGGDVEEYTCSCPYDIGPLCKHIVSVFFAIREKQKGVSASCENSDYRWKKTQKVKPEKTFEEILSDMPRTKLNTALLNYASGDPDFVEHIFNQGSQDAFQGRFVDKEYCRRVIQPKMLTS